MVLIASITYTTQIFISIYLFNKWNKEQILTNFTDIKIEDLETWSKKEKRYNNTESDLVNGKLIDSQTADLTELFPNISPDASLPNASMYTNELEKESAPDDFPANPNINTWISNKLLDQCLSSPNYNLHKPLKQNYRDLYVYSAAIQDE